MTSEQRLREALAAWRDRVQEFCFYWKETRRRGRCKELNGHYCVFCELSDKFDADLAALASTPVQQVGARLSEEQVRNIPRPLLFRENGEHESEAILLSDVLALLAAPSPAPPSSDWEDLGENACPQCGKDITKGHHSTLQGCYSADAPLSASLAQPIGEQTYTRQQIRQIYYDCETEDAMPSFEEWLAAEHREAPAQAHMG